jgi:drug/metabolite transporter superfamily protein YnfA
MSRFAAALLVWLVFAGAAVLEVGGDAVIRKGLWGKGLVFVGAGCVMLASYGILVNLVRWDFSKLLGVYVAVFALMSVLCGRFLFRESVPVSTWVGLALILGGGLVIQFGPK